MVYVYFNNSKIIFIVILRFDDFLLNGLIFKNFGRACSGDRAAVKMDMPKIQFILRSHNEKRNQIALGLLPNYQSAAKMPVMVSNN